jgi:hypothetical protein
MLSKTSSQTRKRIRFRPLQKLASLSDRRKIDDLAYYLGPASRAEPKILETTEIFFAVAAECEAIAHELLPPDDWCLVSQEQRTNKFAPIIQKKLLERYPQLEGRVRIVYKRSGGWFDPNGRYVPIFEGASSHSRLLSGVLKQTFRKDGIDIPRRSTTCLNDVARDHAIIKKARKQVIAARIDAHSPVLKRLRIIRFSSWAGVENARQFKPYIVTGHVINLARIPTLYVVQSARQRDITHNKRVRAALLMLNPDVVQLADVDRLGREYWKAAYNSFRAMGIRVEFKDPEWVPDMHLRRGKTKIDHQTEALDGVCVVHVKDIDRSKIKDKDLLAFLRRVQNHFLIKKEKLILLGLRPWEFEERVIGRFGNAFSEIVQIANCSRRSYILTRSSASLTARKGPSSTRSQVSKYLLPTRALQIANSRPRIFGAKSHPTINSRSSCKALLKSKG